MPTKIALCQTPDIRKDLNSSLAWIARFTSQAEKSGASLICFPECFLQGYPTEKTSAEKNSIDLRSPAFEAILDRLSEFEPMLVIGMIEAENGKLFNAAAVVKKGALIGKYRKTHLLRGERFFTPGLEYPVFETGDLKFGINICYDTQFAESAAAIAKQGAHAILCPSNNMMRYETAENYKHLHHEMRIERVRENKIWLLSSDVTGERDGRISYGPTSAINPDGKIIAQVPLLKTGMVTVEI